MHSGPSSARHSSTVNSARTSTASDLHAGPQFAPTCHVRQFGHCTPHNHRYQLYPPFLVQSQLCRVAPEQNALSG
ncbi:hypothetical protein B7P43_G10119 [Cryptotermes secundus]|uniref:Uncharacterized protein n=2 Tax=Cryptotermes secundus TaxID=105785 RepID=A0A2J7QXK7_9NEOP|nr:hypothetical protein B7P43_G10119 [Cryptotermes secundus]